MNNNEHKIVLYQIDDTNFCVNVYYADETFWLTQKAMAELFDVNVPAISKHLTNIFDEGELDSDSTVSKIETVQKGLETALILSHRGSILPWVFIILYILIQYKRMEVI